MTFTDLADELMVKQSDSFELEISGSFAKFVDQKKNLLTEILSFFCDKFGITKNLHIKLKKNIPVGAGLGGGSSDAACLMKSLNEIFVLNLSKDELQKISLNFGSDIPFFFEDKSAIISGRGEIIENFPTFQSMPALLINPGINLSTKEIFQKYGQLKCAFSTKVPIKKLLRDDVFELIKLLPNDLDKAAISSAPIINQILEKLKESGADFAKMSGSGPTCFGIFLKKEKLEEAETKLRELFPHFFLRKIKILSHVCEDSF